MNVFVFDIETVPDTDVGRKLLDLDSKLSDAEVAKAMYSLRRAEKGTDFLPLHLHKVVAISLVLRDSDKVRVWSLGDIDSDEKELVSRFFHGLDKYLPTIVSWNGQGFDLPVLHYRALLHKIQAKMYWEAGNKVNDWKWNNYLSRYHSRHLDLMDVLSAYQIKGAAPLDEVATMLGFPGKMGMDGSKVWDEYLQGNIEKIRNYCETDVLNTYLVYLHFEYMRGNLSEDNLKFEHELLENYLEQENAVHLTAFLNNLRYNRGIPVE